MTRHPGVCVAVALALSTLQSVHAQELPVRIAGAAPSALTARVRDALASLGHRTLAVAETASGAIVEVRIEAPTEAALAAWVTAPRRAPTRVEVDAREPEAAGLFALRVAEAVQAAMLPAPVSSTPTVTAPAPPPLPPPPAEARPFSVGVGARVLYAPGGADAMVLPWVRAALGVPWRSVVWQVEVSFAGPSAFGDAGSATLSAIEVTLGAGASLPLARSLRVEAGARASYFALRLALANTAQPARDGAWAMSAVAALRWSVHHRVSLRAGASLGATLGAVDLGIGAVTVAQWGRPLVGAELGVEVRF